MKSLEKLKDMLCEELDKIGKKGELSAGMLETVHKLTDTIKNIDKIEMYEQYEEDGGSSYARGRGRNARRDSMGRYSREGGPSYDGDYSEEGYSEEGGSYRRGGGSSYAGGQGGNMGGGGMASYARGGRGGSSRRGGGYSYGGAKDYMIDKMEEMMDMAESEQERKAIQQCIQKLEQA